MSLRIIKPDNHDSLKKGISALEWLLKQPDTDPKSKEIYDRTLKEYRTKLQQIGK